MIAFEWIWKFPESWNEKLKFLKNICRLRYFFNIEDVKKVSTCYYSFFPTKNFFRSTFPGNMSRIWGQSFIWVWGLWKYFHIRRRYPGKTGFFGFFKKDSAPSILNRFSICLHHWNRKKNAYKTSSSKLKSAHAHARKSQKTCFFTQS